MAASILSSIILFLVFFILSFFVDGKAFAGHMEHRELSGAKVTMAMRRNLQGNGPASKGAVHHSESTKGGSKNTKKEPSKTNLDQAKPQGQSNKTELCTIYARCKRIPLA
ncbi:unnamed protein product [Thlaspi arvense]|uniref:Uncharacterized protein n=1 Tax=Thlaspi arvense TaxID=13288 RepID=A0AAU9R5V4_THLAR|nr:unnamed protein product [Thlaspi arvense]